MKKPNVRAKVERLRAAVLETRKALADVLSAAAAADHLRNSRREGVDPPVQAEELHKLLHRFAVENEPGFASLPEKTRAGPKEQPGQPHPRT